MSWSVEEVSARVPLTRPRVPPVVDFKHVPAYPQVSAWAVHTIRKAIVNLTILARRTPVALKNEG